MRLKIHYSLLLVLGATLLTACGGAGGCSGSGSQPNVATAQLSIDAMTAVPVINGAATKGTLYIHNNGTRTANGLNFSLNNSTTSSKLKSTLAALGVHLNGSLVNTNGFTLINPELCTSIPAGGSCAINFSTPGLAAGDRGNSLVSLSYQSNGSNLTTNQVVNYQYTSLSALSGVNFSGSLNALNISGAQGSTHHVVGYLYGGGASGSKYQNVSLSSSSAATNISNGFINGQEVAAGQVIAVELAITLQNDKSSTVNVVPQWGTLQSNSAKQHATLGTPAGNSGASLSLTLTPTQNTVNYIFGDIPILSAPTTSAAVINVTNNGNADGSGNLTATTNNPALTIDDSNCQSTALLANAVNSCTISFSVAGYTPGSATVTFKDNNNNTVGTQVVIWSNNMPVPAVYITPNQSSITFAKGVSTPANSTVFTLTNIGQAPLNSASYTPTNTGAATWTQDGTTCTTSIAPLGSCTISGHFTGTNDGNGKFYISALGSYNSINYSFVALPLSYQVIAAPSLAITPSSISWTLLANGVDSKSQTFTVENVGSDPALFTALNLIESNTTVKPTISGGTCSGSTTLNETESCTVIVSYGPAAASNTANESGIANININYHGGTPDTAYNAQDAINYNLVGNDTTVVVGGPTATIPGNGQESNPFSGNPGLNPQTITLTYTNPSVNYDLINFNLNTNNLPYGLVVDPSSTCATGANTMTLAKNQTCNLVVKLDRDLLTNSPSGGSVVLDYTSPTATWTTPMGFYSQSGSMVYVNYLQPTIAFTLSNNNGNFESTVLSMTAANVNTVSSLSANVWGVSNWLESIPVNPSSNCTVNASDYSVSCNLKTTTSGSVSYIMPNYLQADQAASIPLKFSTTSGEYAYLNPGYTFINYVLVNVSTVPTNNAANVSTQLNQLTITFSADVESSSVNATNITLTENGSSNNLLASCTSVDSKTYVCTTAVGLVPNTIYNFMGSNLLTTSSGFPIEFSSHFTTANTTKYAYIGSYSGGVYKCAISNINGALSGCIQEESSISQVEAVSVINGKAYLSSGNTNTLYLCDLDSVTGDVSNCNGTGSGFSKPRGVVTTRNYAYVANGETTTISKCSVSNDGALSGCGDANVTGISDPQGLTINNNYLLIASAGNSKIITCVIDPVTGLATSCNGNANPPAKNYQDVKIIGNIGYVIANSYVANCSYSASSGLLGSCTSSSSLAGGSYEGLAIYNNMIYTSSVGGTIGWCPLNSNGTISNSNCGSITGVGNARGMSIN